MIVFYGLEIIGSFIVVFNLNQAQGAVLNQNYEV